MATDSETAGDGLRKLFRTLNRRRGTVLLVVFLFVAPAVTYSLLQSPIYAASSRVVVQPSTSGLDDTAAAAAAGDAKRTLATQLQVFAGEPLRDGVRSKLGSVPGVSVKAISGTDIIEITAHSGGPRRAKAIADAYADAYVELRQSQAADSLTSAAQQVQARLADAQKRLADLDTQIAAAPADRQSALRQAPDHTALTAQVAVLSLRLDNLQASQGLASGGAALVSHARVPTDPVSPRPVRAGLLALGLGLVVGIAAALVQEYLDDSVKTREELARVAGGHPVLGVIPVVDERAGAGDLVISLGAPRAPAAEAYRSLRTSIQFLALDTPVVTIEVTSPSPREGKTTTVANLGVAMARAGQRVVIVGCDLRRPVIHEFFGLDGSLGLTSVILGKAPLSAVLQPVPGQNRLSVLPTGPLPPNPAEILSSWRFAEVLTSLQQNADVVLVDAPPVLPVTDAMVLSGRVDATVLVVLAGVTARQEVTRAVELLTQVRAPIVGTVLNGVADTGEWGYGADYYRSADPSGDPAAPR